MHLACGSNGGPPLAQLRDWSGFGSCAPEPDGLREVYFEYDDAAERRARAAGDFTVGWSAGTAYKAFPIIASALFSPNGELRAIRIVTDPRPEQRKDVFLHLRPRREHYLLALYLMDKFGVTDADCHDLPATKGESPVLGMFEKQVCDRAVDSVAYHLESRLLRRRGETDVDAETGTLTEGRYVSETRAEVRLVSE